MIVCQIQSLALRETSPWSALHTGSSFELTSKERNKRVYNLLDSEIEKPTIEMHVQKELVGGMPHVRCLLRWLGRNELERPCLWTQVDSTATKNNNVYFLRQKLYKIHD